MYTLGFDGVILHQVVLLFLSFSRRKRFVAFHFGQLSGYVWQHEELRVLASACKFVDTFVSQFYGTVLFVNHKVEWFHSFGHLAVIVLHVVGFRFEKYLFHAFH